MKMLKWAFAGLATVAWLLAMTQPGQAQQRSRGKAGEFDYYVTSLSWSPQYCAGKTNLPPSDPQCGTGRNYAFVLHGLWPQYNKGWPQFCASASPVPQALIDQMLAIMPSAKLIQHEWDKHGTCDGATVEAYFAKAVKAFQAVKIPPALVRPDKPVTMTAAAIRQAFIEAGTPGLAAQSLVIGCSGRYVSEVRVCMDKSLSPMACTGNPQDSCRKGNLIFRPVRLAQ